MKKLMALIFSMIFTMSLISVNCVGHAGCFFIGYGEDGFEVKNGVPDECDVALDSRIYCSKEEALAEYDRLNLSEVKFIEDNYPDYNSFFTCTIL